jgi:hypothetical protein
MRRVSASQAAASHLGLGAPGCMRAITRVYKAIELIDQNVSHDSCCMHEVLYFVSFFAQ